MIAADLVIGRKKWGCVFRWSFEKTVYCRPGDQTPRVPGFDSKNLGAEPLVRRICKRFSNNGKFIIE
jgi:hypothetical protein